MRRHVLFGIFFGLLSLLPLTASAADCYFMGSYGSGSYSRDRTDKFEDRLLGSDYIEGSYVVDRNSRPWELGVGCNLNRYAAVEAVHFQGFRHRVSTSLAACVEVHGEKFCTAPERIEREATLQAWQLSVLGKYPLGQRDEWSLMGRLGILHGEAQVRVRVPALSEEYEVSVRKTGNIYVAGLGLMYRPKGADWSLALEHRRFDQSSQVTMLSLRWYL